MILPSVSTLVSLAVVYGLLLALLRRPWTACALTLYVIGFVLLSSYLKHAYLGMAMTLADMHFFLLRPIENFKLFAAYPVLGLTLIAVLAGTALAVALGRRWERPLRLLSQPRTGWLRCLGIAALSAALGGGASIVDEQAAKDRADNNDAWAAFQTMYEQQHPGGPVGRINVFFRNRTFAAELPPERELRRFLNSAPAPAVSAPLPDILLVLEESTFDTRLLRDCPPALCDHALFHPPRNSVRTVQGPLLVHTTGGGTWLAEFAIVAGLDWRVFGRGGAFAPVSLAPRLHVSLPQHLRALGYRTIAIYPTDGNFLSAETAYEHYGFDEFYDRKELQLPDDWLQVRDGLVFERLQTLAQRRDARPVFVFALTIRNHGPHGGEPATIPAAFRPGPVISSAPMADVLARTRDSAQDFAALADRWLAASTPRVLAWFGDHQPEAAWEYTAHIEKLDLDGWPRNVALSQSQYLTYFQMSANFGGRSVVTERDATDLSFVGARLLNFAGVPLDAGHTAALKIMQECNGLMIDCADRELIADYLSFRVHDLRAVE